MKKTRRVRNKLCKCEIYMHFYTDISANRAASGDVESRVMSSSNAVYHKSIGSTVRRITHTHCALPTLPTPPPLSEYAYNIPYIRALSTSQLICCTRRALFIWIHIYQLVRREQQKQEIRKKLSKLKKFVFTQNLSKV